MTAHSELVARLEGASEGSRATYPFAFGSQTLPGLAKLAEECGEVVQVIGKLMMTGGAAAHWDGTDLITRLTEELGDLTAALVFVVDRTGLDERAISDRGERKLALFEQWHREQDQTQPQPDGEKT